MADNETASLLKSCLFDIFSVTDRVKNIHKLRTQWYHYSRDVDLFYRKYPSLRGRMTPEMIQVGTGRVNQVFESYKEEFFENIVNQMSLHYRNTNYNSLDPNMRKEQMMFFCAYEEICRKYHYELNIKFIDMFFEVRRRLLPD